MPTIWCREALHKQTNKQTHTARVQKATKMFRLFAQRDFFFLALLQFYHLTYEGAVDIDAIHDPVERVRAQSAFLLLGCVFLLWLVSQRCEPQRAVEMQISEFGQVCAVGWRFASMRMTRFSADADATVHDAASS